MRTQLVVNQSKFAGLRDFPINHHPHPAIQDASGELKRENALGNSSPIALTRAGLEVGALGAKSTDRGLQIRGSAFNPIHWTGSAIVNAPAIF
jgi:hypothetical protein